MQIVLQNSCSMQTSDLHRQEVLCHAIEQVATYELANCVTGQQAAQLLSRSAACSLCSMLGPEHLLSSGWLHAYLNAVL